MTTIKDVKVKLETDSEQEYLDLEIQNGDFVIGDSTQQHQHILLTAHQGHIREFIRAGVGISNYLLNESYAEMGSAIKWQFENDGMKVEKIDLSNTGQLQILAKYE